MIATDTVRTLRQYHGSGYSISELAAWSGLSRRTVSNVVNFVTHKRVSVDPGLPPLHKLGVEDGKAPPPRLEGKYANALKHMLLPAAERPQLPPG